MNVRRFARLVAQAQAAAAAAAARGVRNPSPHGLIRLVARREIQTARFRLLEGEQWDCQFRRFVPAAKPEHVEIGHTLVPISWVQPVGLAYGLEEI